MKRLLSLAVLLTLTVSVWAQKPYKVVFYNVENLFDLVDDPDVRDSEFTPDGPKKWNETKYAQKMANLEKVFSAIAMMGKGDKMTVDDYPVVIGVSEVENRSVMEDLASLRKLSPARYKICHFDSPDKRGIDVAFLYRSDVFKLQGCAAIPYTIDSKPDFCTRDFVTMWGTIEGEPFYFMVTHWPSRRGGKEQSDYLRERAAEIMKQAADSVRAANPNVKVVMMGDFNDDATDDTIVKVLGAGGRFQEIPEGGLYNPFNSILRSGKGTLAYRDSWNLFDNIIVSENLATGSTGKLKLQKVDKKFYGGIFTRPYMIQKEGQFKGYPLRTFVGNNFQGGFSDHFPVYIYIGK